MNSSRKMALTFLVYFGIATWLNAAMAQESAPPPGPRETGAVVPITRQLSEVRSGKYVLEYDHGRVHWSASHHGFSTFTAVFPVIDATLSFDAEDVTQSELEAIVDMKKVDSSIEIFDQRLNSSAWFDTEKHPTSRFKSTKVVRAGRNQLSVTGDLTFMGVTRPLTMDVTFVQAGDLGRPPGGYRVGFNGVAVMHRSEWGMPMSTVGDEIALSIEAEFLVAESAVSE